MAVTDVSTVQARFQGGPWDDQLRELQWCTQTIHPGGDSAGNLYWLDATSDPPVYYWHEEQGEA